MIHLSPGEVAELLGFCRRILAAGLTPQEAERHSFLETRLDAGLLSPAECLEYKGLIEKSLDPGIALEEFPRLYDLVMRSRRIDCTDAEFDLFERACARMQVLDREGFRQLCAWVLVLRDAGEDVSHLVAPDILDDLQRARKGTLNWEAVEFRHKARMRQTGRFTIGNSPLPFPWI